MINKTGNLFDTDAIFIGHGVNCKGMMGAGIAAEFKRRYPKNFAKYQIACRGYLLTPGEYFAVSDDSDPDNIKVIVNFASQDKPGADASYDWVFSSLRRFAEAANNHPQYAGEKITVAIPEIGCGIGGLDWQLVEFIIEVIEQMYPNVEFEVWHLS